MWDKRTGDVLPVLEYLRPVAAVRIEDFAALLVVPEEPEPSIIQFVADLTPLVEVV